MNSLKAIGICPQLVFDSMPVPNSSRKVVVIVSLVLFFGMPFTVLCLQIIPNSQPFFKEMDLL